MEVLRLLVEDISLQAALPAATARRTAAVVAAEVVERLSVGIVAADVEVEEIAAPLARPTARQLHRQPQQLAEATRRKTSLLSRLLRVGAVMLVRGMQLLLLPASTRTSNGELFTRTTLTSPSLVDLS